MVQISATTICLSFFDEGRWDNAAWHNAPFCSNILVNVKYQYEWVWCLRALSLKYEVNNFIFLVNYWIEIKTQLKDWICRCNERKHLKGHNYLTEKSRSKNWRNKNRIVLVHNLVRVSCVFFSSEYPDYPANIMKASA